MPHVEIKIGGRNFEVACQEGEEHFLTSAAAMLDIEAAHLAAQVGRITEARMLLMAGLMLADKTAGLEDKIKEADARVAQLQAQVAIMENRPAERIEVPVVPAGVTDTLAEIAARAEALADQIEGEAASGA